MNHQPLENVSHLVEHEIEDDACVGQDHPFRRAVANVALVPECIILSRGSRVPTQEPSQSADSLRCVRISLMWHGGRTLVPGVEWLFNFTDFRPLQMPDLGGELLQRSADAGYHRHE